MDGVLIIDKPADFTSFDVVAKMRGILKTRKIGHAGTLDPMATGVLPLLIGSATRAMDILPDERKRYAARLRLGITTDTQDISGEIVLRREVNASPEDVKKAAASFLGDIMQIPPMHSAIQVGGKRLYDLARNGVEIERAARPVTIGHISAAHTGGDEYELDILCSKGTYIRTICHDIGEKLGCGAVMTYLRRTMAAGFTLEDAITIGQAQELADDGRIQDRLLPPGKLFSGLPAIRLDGRKEALFTNGVKTIIAGEAGRYSVYGASGFLGIADTDSGGIIIKRKLFINS